MSHRNTLNRFGMVLERYRGSDELPTSKEKLQSLIKELTALNSQLQHTLDLQRARALELQNILSSTDVATIFLDRELDLRFFTPMTKSLFSIISTDIGRPLADLPSRVADHELLVDAITVLQELTPIEREIQAPDGRWFIRRILPCRAEDATVEGVVIIFTDITDRRRIAEALELAKSEAQRANLAKSRFLAVASHDLRQPLQALSLMRGLLEKRIKDDRKVDALSLVARIDETTTVMADMLNTMLDINQLEAGTIHPHIVRFTMNDLLDRLREEYSFHADNEKLLLRIMPCSLAVHSDPQLLEQMIRNLLSNALKYTKRGKVLLGCRRRGGLLSIGIWDTGIGIEERELQAIFEEYHQVDIEAQDRAGGLGLGLSIVQRLGGLLFHSVQVRSRPGQGSVFSIDVMIAQDEILPAEQVSLPPPPREEEARLGTVLIIEDDADLRDLSEMVLRDQGHVVVTAADGKAALDLLARKNLRPDLILSDYNLPGDMNGLAVAARIRARVGYALPVIILTGDISTDSMRLIALEECVQLNKPVEAADIILAVHLLMPEVRGRLAGTSVGVEPA